MTISLTRFRPAARRPFQMAPLSRYFTVWGQRRALAQLSPTNLRDMGISPAQAATEAARPIWDLPRLGRD